MRAEPSPSMLAPDAVPSRHDPPLVVPWRVIAMVTVGFILLGLSTRGTNTMRIDLRVSELVQRFDGSVGEVMAEAGNFLGWSRVGVVLFAIGWVGFAILRRRRELWFALFLILGRVLATQLKD